MKYTFVCEKEHLFVVFFVPVKFTRSPYGRYFFFFTTSLADTCVGGNAKTSFYIDRSMFNCVRSSPNKTESAPERQISVCRAVLSFSASEHASSLIHHDNDIKLGYNSRISDSVVTEYFSSWESRFFFQRMPQIESYLDCITWYECIDFLIPFPPSIIE